MPENQHSLKPGTILQSYEIIRVLGEGGFGITYLAKDNELGLEVVIKEYFPNEFAMRSNDKTITAKTKSMGDFAKGMQRFKEEAQILAKFNHPSIVKILGFFEANDTAYFVMEYEEGIDLSQYLKQQRRALSQEEILSIMMPILEGLKEVHKYKYLHRDIKPGNILLRSNKSPVLIDFGASKLAIGEASKSITSMLTEGYAPLEQYSTDIKQQGPFTDIYAVAAVIYKMITGEVPPSAQTRSYALLSGGNDPYKALSILKLSKYDNSFLKAVDHALDINANKRPQNVQEFQADIAGKSKVDSGGKNNNMIVLFLVLLILIGEGYFFLNQSDNVNAPIDITEISQKKDAKEKIEVERLEKERNDNLRKERSEKKKKKLEKEKAESERIETERLKKEQEKNENLRREKAKVQKEEFERLKKEEILKNKVVQRINKKVIEQKNEVNRKAVERTNSKKRIYQQKLQEWNEQISLVCSFAKGVYKKDIETIANIKIKAEKKCKVFQDGSALCYDEQGKDYHFGSGELNKNKAQKFNRDSYCSTTLDKCLYFSFDINELVNIEGCDINKKSKVNKNKLLIDVNSEAIDRKNEANRKAIKRANEKKRIYQQKLREWNELTLLVCSFAKGVYKKDIETIANIKIRVEKKCKVFQDGSALCYDEQGKDYHFGSGELNKNKAQKFNRDSYCSATLDKCLYFSFDNNELVNIEGCDNEKN